ncbi:hypothetical protein DY000_02048594 [Brassica cretica]|uniref:Uncharacterized protein n=1 Tax=Brassica cretica TaxID=69181 RepID=A0ABQ7EXJ8_BRACR|nr:hypothetical protein DY000_02048594 [Brassica cretica]
MDLHKLVLVPLEYAMQMMSANCKSCSALSTSVKTQKMLLCESKTISLPGFINPVAEIQLHYYNGYGALLHGGTGGRYGINTA